MDSAGLAINFWTVDPTRLEGSSSSAKPAPRCLTPEAPTPPRRNRIWTQRQQAPAAPSLLVFFTSLIDSRFRLIFVWIFPFFVGNPECKQKSDLSPRIPAEARRDDQRA